METRTISIKEVIGRIKDHPILERVPVDTLIDYSVDFLRLMGIPETFDEKTAILSIDKFRAKLPDDFLKMIAVRTSNFRSKLTVYAYKDADDIIVPDEIILDSTPGSQDWLTVIAKTDWDASLSDNPAIPSEDVGEEKHAVSAIYFDYDKVVDLIVESNLDWTAKISDQPAQQEVPSKPRGYCGPTQYYRYSTDSFHMSEHKSYRDMLTYKLQGDYLISSQMYGKIEISYKALALDECGFPLLPDDAKFIRALEAYIKYKRFRIEFEVGRLPLQVLEKAEQDYYYCKGACIAGFHLTSMDKFEAAINTWKNFLIRDNEHQRGYATLGDKEYLRVQR